MKKGLFTVIDGVDGSGKTTQIELLTKFLKKKKIPHEVISFPRYGNNIYANLVKRYLEGEFGSINDVNPYLMSLAYGGDRMLAKPLVEKWLKKGKVVIANRYVSSNKAHLGANLSLKDRKTFIEWLDELEYKTNQIPKEDMTILLLINPQVGQRNVTQKHRRDIHEASLKHLEEANKIYLQLSKTQTNWVVVDCMKNGQMRSREEIHQDIMQIFTTKLPT